MLAVNCDSLHPNEKDLSKKDCYPEEKDIRFSKLPIQEGCKCYTCENYTRGYLYHLFDVKEINATILLGIHNSYVYDQLFVNLRENSSVKYLAWLLDTQFIRK